MQPIVYIYAAAPSAEGAQQLANAAVSGLKDLLADLARQRRFSEGDVPQIRQLGAAHGVISNRRAKPVIAAMTFLLAFSVAAAALLSLLWFAVRGPRTLTPSPRPAWDDWPNTDRLLPWCVAAFIAMLWLTPFDQIQLTMHTPIDMKLDRLLMPLLVLVWVLAMVTGERARPRLRITPIHVAVFVFAAVAFLSVVVNAQSLNHYGELMLTVKRLPDFFAYIVLFLIVSTSIRPTEVQAFMTLTLGLAVIVAIGIVWENKFSTNFFRVIADKLTFGPLMFTGEVRDLGVDSLGRRSIVGPTVVGLEAVAIMTLALPIVIVRLTTTRGGRRILYAIMAAVLVAGIFSVGRKSALIAPVSVLLTLGYFRRRELLALAPIGLVIGLIVTTASPGIVRGVLTQFTSSEAGNAATTSDRVADYDAVRPDVWTHLLLGRGFGSYGPTYRLLDSEILSRAIETGVLGLLAFLAVSVTAVLAGRKTIARRDSPFASEALVGAAAAVVFIVASTLFDVTAFPHGTYVFFYITALASVVIGYDVPDAPPPESGALEVQPPRLVTASAGASSQPTHTLV